MEGLCLLNKGDTLDLGGGVILALLFQFLDLDRTNSHCRDQLTNLQTTFCAIG